MAWENVWQAVQSTESRIISETHLARREGRATFAAVPRLEKYGGV